ncbi:Dual specificity protein phosphatase PHS1 [Apostasia shenzhenica]|uniref:Dual specificity protein phosphatase PHS1 n=1 Tax=Apostasia shenzhenica TaxID=1088818 RepID=A0A2I0AQ93_9ASPA|nr:Dual specificity protein phosphatase PHS1 [Apostasia shenzhenica]
MAAEEQKEEKLSSSIIASQASEGEKEQTFPSRVVSFLWGEVAGTAHAFERWVALVRKRSGQFRPSGFPYRPPKTEAMPCAHWTEREQSGSIADSRELDAISDKSFPSYQAPEMSLWERLGNAAVLNIESCGFAWNGLLSLHHTEHTSSNEHSEDETNKALEVTVNSGGVVFFALFNNPENNALLPREATAVIKITSSRLTTLSERLGYEFAKWLGVPTPQSRVVHSSSPEWQAIKDAAENARDAAVSAGDEVIEITCSELLEALEMSRCLLLMNYVHGSPLLESSQAFDSPAAASSIASALGRVLMLDLILRNEDRLHCRLLGWRGNHGNLLFANEIASAKLDSVGGVSFSPFKRFSPAVVENLQKHRKASSMNGRVEITSTSSRENRDDEKEQGSCHVVAIDSGVPRRPPAGKRAKDQESYPRVVELILNSSEYSSNLLHEISDGKLGSPCFEETDLGMDSSSTSNCSFSDSNMIRVVHEFREGFRAALRDLQSFHLFLLTLYQKLDGICRILLTILNKTSEELDKDEFGNPDSPSTLSAFSFSTPLFKDRSVSESYADSGDSDIHRVTPSSSSPGGSGGHRGSPDSVSSCSYDNWSGKYFKGSGEHFRSLRLTMKLRDFLKFAKVDVELNKELEQWIEMLRADVVKFCLEKNFNTGFFDGNDSNIIFDAYELKVRLEHILDRISLISEAANTERPSHVIANLFIGGALAARSLHTLQHLGITHILCLCSNEIGQSDFQYLDLFEYKNFSISDDDEEDISNIFEEACDFIDNVEKSEKKVLVHCFEGKSRSATIVLAYLMLRRGLTLLESWNTLKKVHRRAQPNDGFARALLELDRKIHGKASMDWQQRRPAMKVCPICGKNAGLSTSSLKLHLQKSHKMISSGSVDSAMDMEIQKAMEALKISPRQITESNEIMFRSQSSRSHL